MRENRVWWENLKEKDRLKYPGLGGRTVLIWVFKK
jgi:hypothetical protein